MLEFVMNERPAEVGRWLSEPLSAREKKRILNKKRNELTYKELVIKDRIMNEQGKGLSKYYAPKGARVPQAHPQSPTVYNPQGATKAY